MQMLLVCNHTKLSGKRSHFANTKLGYIPWKLYNKGASQNKCVFIPNAEKGIACRYQISLGLSIWNAPLVLQQAYKPKLK